MIFRELNSVTLEEMPS